MQKNIYFILALCAAIFMSCKDDITEEPASTAGGTGLKFNSTGSTDKVEEADIDEDGITLPAKFILNGPPITDQGESSKCVAFSGGYYITSMYNGVINNDAAKSGSPEYLYAQYKAINKDNDCAEGCFLYNDDAAGIVGAAEILLRFGTTNLNQMPFQPNNSCGVINAALTTQAASNKIKDYYQLDKTEFSDVKELKIWLYSGYPLFFGVTIDEGFQAQKAGEVWSKASGNSEGGHAMVIVGYDDAKNAFRIANSWGTDWSDGGYGWVDYDYLVKLLKKDSNPEIGILYPNDAQRINMSKVSPIACGNANWGDIIINNKYTQEVAIEMTGTNNYNNNEMGNIDASDSQVFTRIPSGTVTVKVMKADKSATIKTFTATVSQCKEAILDIQ